MNREEIREEIKRYGFGDLEYNDPILNGVINNVYHEILIKTGDLPFAEIGPEEVIVSAGVEGEISETNLPGDYNKVRAITLGERKLRHLSLDDFIELQITSQSPGDTEYYTIANRDRLLVWPSPENQITLNVWYHKKFTDLSSDEDTPEFEERFHYLIVYGALVKLTAATDDIEAQPLYQGLYDQGIENMRADLEEAEYDRTAPFGDALSLGAIAKLVRENGFTEFSNYSIYMMANITLRELGAKYNWSWLETGPETFEIIDGEGLLPEGAHKPRRVFVGQGGEKTTLDFVKADKFWDDFYTSSETGVPRYYTLWAPDGGTQPRIKVYPTPAGTSELEVVYVRQPSTLTDPGQAPEFPVQHQRVILFGVLIQCALQSQDEFLASKLPIFQQEFDMLEAAFLSDDNDPSFDARGRIEDYSTR